MPSSLSDYGLACFKFSKQLTWNPNLVPVWGCLVPVLPFFDMFLLLNAGFALLSAGFVPFSAGFALFSAGYARKGRRRERFKFSGNPFRAVPWNMLNYGVWSWKVNLCLGKAGEITEKQGSSPRLSGDQGFSRFCVWGSCHPPPNMVHFFLNLKGQETLSCEETGGLLSREYDFGEENSLSLTEFLGQTRWVLRKTRWVRFVAQIVGRDELTKLSPRNSVRAKKLTEFGVWNRTLRNR